ncbi:SP17 protein, partial [Burhinus bistriatus]|nr:SP17 protein [Burhinus bistriatus]
MSIPSSTTTTLRLPAGFQNLLEGLALEVLRAQPTDVVAFAAQHFQMLLEQREGEWPGPAA